MRRSPRQTWLSISGGAVVLLAAGLYFGLGWSALASFLAAISAATFAAYGYDKRAAQHRQPRIPEAVLHLLAAAGGSPGALLGQLYFRHKTSKTRFRVIFGLILAAQAAALGLAWLR